MIDLDKIEAIARAAQESAPTPWTVDKMMTVDLETREEVADFEDDDRGYSVISSRSEWDEIISDPGISHDVAHFVADCSPDVVLELVRMIRERDAELAVLRDCECP